MKKTLAVLCVLALVTFAVACKKEVKKTEKKSKK